MEFRRYVGVVAACALAAASNGAYAKDGNNGRGPSDTARGNSEEHRQDEANRQDGTALTSRASLRFAGVVAGSGASSRVLRFINAGTQAGTATVTLFSSATGAELGSWTSASIAAHGAAQITVSDVLAQAQPSLSTTQLSGLVDLQIATGFRGVVQQISGGGAVNLSACGRRLVDQSGVMGVDGPAGSVASGVRLVNDGAQAKSTTLHLYGVDGVSLGTWTSPSVPVNGSTVVSIPTIAAAATPTPVAATTAALVITQDNESAGSGGGLRLEHVVVGSDGAVSDLTAACVAAGQGKAGKSEDDEDSDD